MSDPQRITLTPTIITPAKTKPIVRQLWEGYPGCFTLLLAGGGVALGWDVPEGMVADGLE